MDGDRLEDSFKGHRFGKYVLGDHLRREGNFIETFEATQVLTDAAVEIRILNVSPADRPVLGKRFLHELQLLAGLSHPGIVHPLDVGEELGRQYYTVPRRNSLTLEDFLALSGGRLQSLDDVLRFGEILTDALGVLHGEGLLHRGISTTSIHVDRDEGRPYFGECSAMKDIRAAYGLSQLGVPTLSEIPVAPEVATGGEWTVRTDLYLMAALLYRILTGHGARPVGAPVQFAAPFARMAPGPDPTRSLASMGTLDGLDAVILRGLAFEPRTRHGSTDELDEDLRRIARKRNLKLFIRAEGSATAAAASPPPSPDPAERRRRARREAAAAASAGSPEGKAPDRSFFWLGLAAGLAFGLAAFFLAWNSGRPPTTVTAAGPGRTTGSRPGTSAPLPASQSTAAAAANLVAVARSTAGQPASTARFTARWDALAAWIRSLPSPPEGVGTHVDLLKTRLLYGQDAATASARLDGWVERAVAVIGAGAPGAPLDAPPSP